jgi:hypothetical protein
MKKYTIYAASLIVIMFAIGTMNLFAQTGGTRPDQKTGTLQVTSGPNQELMNANAVLEVNATNKGILLPRLALVRANLATPLSAHVAGMTVYNTATSAPEVPYKDYLSPGMYYNDGFRWHRMNMGATNWFYMPSIPFNTTTNGTFTKDLYALYSAQFTAPMAKSTSAPTSVPYIPGPTDLYYYITDYDTGVFSAVSITDAGVMTYTVTAAATDCSYINIIFVVK